MMLRSGSYRVCYVLLVLASVVIVSEFIASAIAQDSGYEVSPDSELQLIETSDEGSYRYRSIVIRPQSNSATISTVQDEVKSQATMPLKDYQSLWQFALNRKVESMEDAPLENAYPGQSEFVYIFRDGSNTYQFSAYGVDFLSDLRYRELAREIIRVTELHLSKYYN